jgi:hypothetical protein
MKGIRSVWKPISNRQHGATDFYRLLLGGLAVWRITHLFQAEDGPGDIVVHLRRQAGSGIVGQALDCFYCLSVWVAAPVAALLGRSFGEQVMLWPALSALAIFMERATGQENDNSSDTLFKEWEDDHGVLR